MLATSRSLRNAYAPINRVPNEILVLIFENIPVPKFYTEWLDSPSVSTKDLIPITHVCRRWRDVALSAHFLWSSIHDMPVTQNADFLRRSGASLLNCHM
ncbi:uncharacterized protein BXZ73DRAFT_48775, partial [Epithele typhae]|uniref:uncharacterized protein n=1 Tax=Epithele typhae TaxID=378194 RepID=UPI00200877DB